MAIKALKSNSVTLTLVWECIAALNQLAKVPVNLIWAPSNSRIEGNKSTHVLARSESGNKKGKRLGKKQSIINTAVLF